MIFDISRCHCTSFVNVIVLIFLNVTVNIESKHRISCVNMEWADDWRYTDMMEVECSKCGYRRGVSMISVSIDGLLGVAITAIVTDGASGINLLVVTNRLCMEETPLSSLT